MFSQRARQLKNLDVLNLEYRISVVVFRRQMKWRKPKQIFKIRHIQIDHLSSGQAKKLKSLYHVS